MENMNVHVFNELLLFYKLLTFLIAFYSSDGDLYLETLSHSFQEQDWSLYGGTILHTNMTNK